MAKLTITGRVLVRESHQGVAGVVVRAVWVLDGGKEVHVGSAVSTDRGAFVVSGEAADGTQTLRVIVDAPLGSAFDKPLAVSPPRIVAGGHEEFEIWLDDATVAAAGIVRPSHGGTTVADPLSLLANTSAWLDFNSAHFWEQSFFSSCYVTLLSIRTAVITPLASAP